MNDFDKTFVLVFIIRKYDNFKYMQFSKEDVV